MKPNHLMKVTCEKSITPYTVTRPFVPNTLDRAKGTMGYFFHNKGRLKQGTSFEKLSYEVIYSPTHCRLVSYLSNHLLFMLCLVRCHCHSLFLGMFANYNIIRSSGQHLSKANLTPLTTSHYTVKYISTTRAAGDTRYRGLAH